MVTGGDHWPSDVEGHWSKWLWSLPLRCSGEQLCRQVALHSVGWEAQGRRRRFPGGSRAALMRRGATARTTRMLHWNPPHPPITTYGCWGAQLRDRLSGSTLTPPHPPKECLTVIYLNLQEISKTHNATLKDKQEPRLNQLLSRG